LWELLTRKVPFSHHSNYEKFKRAVCHNHERPVIPDNCEPSLKSLIERCWHANTELRPPFTEIISELDKILVDVAIRDPIGRIFWKSELLNHDEEIFYSDFEEKLFQFLHVPFTNITQEQKDKIAAYQKCCQALFSVQSKSKTEKVLIVDIEWFGKVLMWFGPLPNPESENYNWEVGFLENIRTTLNEKWFHGDLTTKESVDKLSEKLGGTYLIRFSSIPGYYTISQISGGRKVIHQRIKHSPGGPYIIDNDEYNTLNDLVTQRGYTLPCPGSKYQNMDQSSEVSCYVNTV